MTPEQRKKIFDVLVGPMVSCQPDSDFRREAEDLAERDLRELEPIIDEMLEEARRSVKYPRPAPQAARRKPH